jgi:protein SCO1/2
MNATMLQIFRIFAPAPTPRAGQTKLTGRVYNSKFASMKKKAVFLTGFFVLLFVGFYFVLQKIVPGMGKVTLPVLSHVQPFNFDNQEGKRITEKDVAGKVYVAEYFFTTCKGICPKMNTNLHKVYQEYIDNPDFRILSYTVDPETDTVARMKRYADSLGADPAKWWFLTGRKDSLYNLARNSYLLDDPKNNATNINEQFIHTQFVALVDKGGHVRKIYDSLKQDELAELESDIKDLLKEDVQTPRFANSLFNNNPG